VSRDSRHPKFARPALKPFVWHVTNASPSELFGHKLCNVSTFFPSRTIASPIPHCNSPFSKPLPSHRCRIFVVPWSIGPVPTGLRHLRSAVGWQTSQVRFTILPPPSSSPLPPSIIFPSHLFHILALSRCAVLLTLNSPFLSLARWLLMTSPLPYPSLQALEATATAKVPRPRFLWLILTSSDCHHSLQGCTCESHRSFPSSALIMRCSRLRRC
jgi:hypothetical protein